ncbi:arylamine N-acetyltransferase [Streptomyces sp. NBC_00102]|uniref:arylamine N-acetyltransferase family protein n=1 Tax=Streptomyces sp. NBC_00102 TaxID=2975652 RepID=UPI00224F6FC2|nr:arylamine N-acetyltransferase [Streptomyces sp. NBC_00102]MCX5399884.1 arylamine N-acetyltransferase [Streptomyces sp. NBC_00102]
MFDVATYLDRLGHDGGTEATPETLRRLQKQHLMAIPFDNSARTGQGTSSLADVDLDMDVVFGPVVAEGRGGVCFELNGLFRRLLLSLGYRVDHLSAGVRGPGGTFGPDLEHMFLGVRLDGDLWLTDVGFAGPGFLEPLKVGPEVQHQYGVDYRVIESEGYLVVERRIKDGAWQAVYRLQDRPRELSEWAAPAPSSEEDAWNWEGELVAADTVIRARSFETGQRVLVGRRLLTVDDGVETVKVLVTPAAYEAATEQILGRAE